MIKALVRDWMISDPISISENADLPDAYWLMIKNNVRRLLVVDDDKLVGIITMDDLRPKLLTNVVGMYSERTNNILAQIKINQVMTKNPKTASADQSLVEAAQKMLTHNISTLPVMDGENLVGIITEKDIFRALVALAS